MARRSGDREASGVDALIRDTSVTPHTKTTTYLRPDQMDLLDDLRRTHRRSGLRTTSASDLLRAAVDVAEKHPDEWADAVRGVSSPGRMTHL